ncbi:MAG: class III poly(R)-hydroxyalkanoic acid synthase subunit PhaC [Burkholderiaceae bacterium]|nr:class III poly(R)-hydroxyalkanoic acid synthase subunit PhaC [Burkholderiaceae bacterium]
MTDTNAFAEALQRTLALPAEEARKLQRRLDNGFKLAAKINDDEVRLATTPKRAVLRRDKVTLYRYEPQVRQTVRTPVFVVYGLVGRWTMADLQPDRSLIGNLLAQGLDVYVVDWGNPSRADRWLAFDDYVGDYLDACVDHIRAEAGVDKVNLLGICEGGVFTQCYAALFGDKVRNLIVTITPTDFHADQQEHRPDRGFINLWARSLEPRDIERLIDSCGYVPGRFMGLVFSMLTPARSLTKYNLDLLDVLDDEDKLRNFLRMEQWLADRPHHPGEAARQFFIDLYRNNDLAEGRFELCGRKVLLKNIKVPVLNVYALDDHIIPPPCAAALGKLVGTRDYSELALPGGHVGVFVSGKSQGIVADRVVEWVRQRE